MLSSGDGLPLIRAKVVDIASYKPSDADKFLVDTNIWIELGYSRLTAHPESVPMLETTFMASAKKVKSQLFHTPLSLAEIAHVIEQAERELFNKRNHSQLSLKEFRHGEATKRKKVDELVASCWRLVRRLSQSLCSQLDDNATDAVLTSFLENALDGYDLFMLQAMRANNVPQIISNDADFAGVPGIALFTGRYNILKKARQTKQG